MIKKKVINSDKYKTKVLSSWYTSRLEKYITSNGKEYEDFLAAESKFEEKLINLLSKYFLDEVTARLYKAFPEMFKSSSVIEIDESLLGIDKSVYKIKLPISLTVRHTFPIGDGYRFIIKEEDLQLFSKEDLDSLKEYAYEVFETAYRSEKRRYTDSGRPVLNDINNFGQLYRFDADLYEYAIKEFIGEDAVEYEEIDDGLPALTSSDIRKKVIFSNEAKNETILENLKTKIQL